MLIVKFDQIINLDGIVRIELYIGSLRFYDMKNEYVTSIIFGSEEEAREAFNRIWHCYQFGEQIVDL